MTTRCHSEPSGLRPKWLDFPFLELSRNRVQASELTGEAFGEPQFSIAGDAQTKWPSPFCRNFVVTIAVGRGRIASQPVVLDIRVPDIVVLINRDADRVRSVWQRVFAAYTAITANAGDFAHFGQSHPNVAVAVRGDHSRARAGLRYLDLLDGEWARRRT